MDELCLDSRKKDALLGRKLWLKLVEDYNINMSQYVIIMPGKRREYKEAAILNLPAFLKSRKASLAYVISSDEWDMPDNVIPIRLEEKEIGQLVQLYCLYEFAPNVVIASLSEPSGRMGDKLVGKMGLTMDEVFAGIVYSLTGNE